MTPNPSIKTQRVAFSLFEKVLCVGLSLVVFGLAIMLVSTNIATSNAQSQLQTVQTKVTKVQAKICRPHKKSVNFQVGAV
ncbi:hypothetical protein RYX41_07495 [Lactiplantibacillus plantarum]|nr:hypothetical protein [Lactiplantibacillus plantarum]